MVRLTCFWALTHLNMNGLFFNNLVTEFIFLKKEKKTSFGNLEMIWLFSANDVSTSQKLRHFGNHFFPHSRNICFYVNLFRFLSFSE